MHRALTDPAANAPYQLVVSQVCEAFHCLPTRAMWELENDPDLMVLQVLKVRSYLAAKAAVAAAKTEEEMPTGPLAALVMEIESELVRERVERKVRERLAEVAEEPDEP